MMKYLFYFLLIAAFLFLFFYSVIFRLIVTHPLLTSGFGASDFYHFLLYKDWRRCKSADLICYTGLFGKGKTLTAVHQIFENFKRYNNRVIFDTSRGKFVTQKVRVLSNVQLNGIPYEYLKSLSQVVTFAESQADLDLKNDELTVLYVLIDEASVQLNSRNFKSSANGQGNIDPNFLNTLLTCRHYHIAGIYTTSQRFKLEDKLLRDVTQRVVECNKIWRFQIMSVYNAWELENCSNPLLVQPLYRTGFFVTNKDYKNYNTLAVVEGLMRSCKEGDMLSESEILALRCEAPIDNDSIVRPSRFFNRMKNKNKK